MYVTDLIGFNRTILECKGFNVIRLPPHTT